MTPFLLQDALVNEIKAIFAGFELKNARNEPSSLNVYPQFLPAKQTEEDAEHFPYIIVRIIDGGTEGEEEASACKVAILIGVHDEDDKYQGYKDVLNVLRRMETHFYQKRVLAGVFEIQYPYRWAVHEEDTFPYYFGGAETYWTLPAVRQEVRF